MKLLVGVSGSVAAYKALETVRLAVKAGHAVRVIQTPNSEQFVGKASFQALTGAPVLTSEFEEDPSRGAYPGEAPLARTQISHLALVQRADVFLIAPATANTIAKLTAGLADNLVTSAALAASCPVIVAPAMNNRMYLHAATQANIASLRERGVIVIEPSTGELASDAEFGIGRLAEPQILLERCEAEIGCALKERVGVVGAAGAGQPGDGVGQLGGGVGQSGGVVEDASGRRGADFEVRAADELPGVADEISVRVPRNDFAGVRVLVTAGGTQEPIDPVRFLGNRSSGRMGYALAAEAAARGARVTVIAANVSLPDPAGVKVVRVRTAAELARAAKAAFDECDVLLMAAAVADFKPSRSASHKLKKDSAEAPKKLKLKPTQDVLSKLAERRKPGQTLIGFAAEHGEDAIEYGRGKLYRKRLDAVVINDVSDPEIGFESADNEVTIVTRDGHEEHVAKAPKSEIAAALLDAVHGLRTLTVFEAR